MDNYQLVTKGFQILTEILAPYVAQQLQAQFHTSWWREGVLEILRDDQTRDLPRDGDYGTLVDSLDAARCLLLIDLHWKMIFRLKLSREHYNWVKELVTTRNKWAHKGGGELSDGDAWRAIDTMARLLEQLDSEATEGLRELVRQIRYGTTAASTTVQKLDVIPDASASTSFIASGVPSSIGLPAWRMVVEPHPDVAQGRYRQAEFAADLSQVLRGTAQIEYQDPVEFFGRTYVTEGMSGLMQQAVRRVSGQGGEPVIQLKTAFGGGKTHSMLALYHLLKGQASIDKIPNAKEILTKAGVAACPKTKVAILVGTALNPSKTRRPINFPGITIRTLWGEMAAQLAEQTSDDETVKNKVYDYVRDADRMGVSPGSDSLRELFDHCGPCLILIDELVAYARRIYGVEGLPAGTFDTVLSFVQELTEAARASRDSLVVASIPESEIEAGGEIGQKALEIIAHTFGRMESIWKPVGAEEGFAIVQRRLFLPIQDEAARQEVCRAFSAMYNQSGHDFPVESKELAYLERMKDCYPIHPEIFDRLYNDWASLERFQKTRGVLRLMAAVIHDLWVRGDNSLMIMPGSIPLDSMPVREELTRHLADGWNSVLEKDVDGTRSLTYKIDENNSRFGKYMAARRVARAIFMGSAPSVREQRNRGIEDIRVRLGVIQPGEQVAVFNDALSHMIEKLTHLYPAPPRYWYDLPPNLRRTVEDRAQQVRREDLLMELERRLKTVRERGDFSGVHGCPASSLDVPDEQAVRLVVIAPEYCHNQNVSDSAALTFAKDVLNNRGSAPRLYRNMLVFVAPDKDMMANLETEARRYLAWKSVVDDFEVLNLDAHQNREAKTGMERSDGTVNLRIKETYIWLLVPTQEGTNPIEWDIARLTGGGESHVVKASRKLRQSEQLIVKWAPALLRMELDKCLWTTQDAIQIKKLWEYLTSYCYLPRLKDSQVLLEAIKDGLGLRDYFGYAAGVTELGKYLELGLEDTGLAFRLQLSGFLVKPEVAERELRIVVPPSTPPYQPEPPIVPPIYPPYQPPIGPPGGGQMRERKLRRFHASVEVDPLRLNRDSDLISREIIQHLNSLVEANVKITIEIEADVPEGVPDGVVRTVSENCRTLKFKDHGFEEY